MESFVNTLGDNKPHLTHEERTKDQPRENEIHSVILSQIKLSNNPIVRLIELEPTQKGKIIKYLPGQWLDVFCPGVSQAGGFTITSTPETGLDRPDVGSEHRTYIELAIQWSPRNAPAAWLWKSEDEILKTELHIRAGGDFVWPPPGIPAESRKRVLFIAGGVGINPFISILSHISQTGVSLDSVTVLYGSKSNEPDCSDVLFLPRITKIVSNCSPSIKQMEARIFATKGDSNNTEQITASETQVPQIIPRRMTPDDVELALGRDPPHRQSTVIYICGPQAMADEFVDTVKGFSGVKPENVLCEKWW